MLLSRHFWRPLAALFWSAAFFEAGLGNRSLYFPADHFSKKVDIYGAFIVSEK
jgi:hypothetical protein